MSSRGSFLKRSFDTIFKVSYSQEQIQMLAGFLNLSNKFNFTLTIDFIIMVTEPIMVQKVALYHRFTDGKLGRVIFIDIMIKLVPLLSPEVVNGMVVNVEQVTKVTGRSIKYFSIWEVAMRVASKLDALNWPNQSRYIFHLISYISFLHLSFHTFCFEIKLSHRVLQRAHTIIRPYH